jgi:hypothetical protein
VNRLGDGVPVKGSALKRMEDQKVERALEEIRLGRVNRRLHQQPGGLSRTEESTRIIDGRTLGLSIGGHRQQLPVVGLGQLPVPGFLSGLTGSGQERLLGFGIEKGMPASPLRDRTVVERRGCRRWRSAPCRSRSRRCGRRVRPAARKGKMLRQESRSTCSAS